MKLKKYLILSILLLFYFCLLNIQIFAKEPEIVANNAIIYSLDNDQILYHKNEKLSSYPASITKILTALLVIENGDLEDELQMSSKALNLEENSSNIGMKKNEKITVKDALYGLLLESANEIANELSYYLEKKLNQKYVDLVGEKLKSLGLTDTAFKNPSGLHDGNHYTTAYDMAVIAKEAFSNPTFREIITSISYTIPQTNLTGRRDLFSSHKMLYSSFEYYHKSVLGGKTGFTSEAGNTLVTFASMNQINVVVVVLKSNTNNVYKDTYRLLEYAFKHFSKKIVIQKDTIVDEVSVIYKNETFDKVRVVLDSDFSLVLPDELVTTNILENKNKDFEVKISLPKELHDSVSQGDLIGTIKVYQNTKLITSANLLAQNSVELPASKTNIPIIPAQDQYAFYLLNNVLFYISLACLAFLSYALYILKKEEKKI